MNIETPSLFNNCVLWYTGEEQANPSVKTITTNGDVRQYMTHNGVTSPVSGSGLAYFDGSGDYLSIANNQCFDIQLGSNNFTIEGWFYFNTISEYRILINFDTFNTYAGFCMYQNTDGILYFNTNATGGSPWIQTYKSIGSVGWHFIQIVRNGTTLTMYIDNNAGTSGTLFGSIVSTTSSFDLGKSSVNTDPAFYGYISEFRISDVVRTIVTPTTPFIPDSNTKLLLHFANTTSPTTFVDSAKNYLPIDCPILPSGVTVTNYGTFGRLDLGNNHVVRTFDGSTSYVSLSDNDAWNFGSGNFTICFWVMHSSISGSPIYSIYWYIGYNTDRIGMAYYLTYIYFHARIGSVDKALYKYTFTPILSNWYFMAFVRDGISGQLYLNGVPVGSATTAISTNEMPNLSQTLDICHYAESGSGPHYYLNGNIKDLLIYKGRALTVAELTTIMRLTDPRAASMGEGISPGGFDYWRVS